MVASYQDNAASIRGLAMRVTRLDVDGSPMVGGTDGCDSYVTKGFIRASFTPNYSEGDEIEIKSASGEVCVYSKTPDVLKDTTLSLELCDPDPILTQMLVGGVVLSSATDCLPSGETGPVAAGWATEKTGVAATVATAIEVWSYAIVGGKPAANCPYWHWLFPYLGPMKQSGERVIENGALATVFEGRSVGNAEFGSGPNMTLTPPEVSADYEWKYPLYSDRSFAYARAVKAPVGLSGCYVSTAPAG